MDVSELVKLKISNFLKFSKFQKSKIFNFTSSEMSKFFILLFLNIPGFSLTFLTFGSHNFSSIFSRHCVRLISKFVSFVLFPVAACMFSLCMQGFSPGAPTSSLNLKVVAASRQNAEPQHGSDRCLELKLLRWDADDSIRKELKDPGSGCVIRRLPRQPKVGGNKSGLSEGF